MTNWLPNLSTGTGPLYMRLADHIETAISNGELAAGTKLPPQRNLAYDLGVTIGTVSRAYSLVHERGLVSGEVGRGTYVNSRHTPTPSVHIGQAANTSNAAVSAAETKQLSKLDTTAAPTVGQGVLIERHLSDIMAERAAQVASYARDFPEEWSVAGARWLAQNGWTPSPENIVPTIGAHAAVMGIIGAVTSPGDRIAFEHLTYSQISRSAALAGRRIALVDSDENGIIPEDFERVCAQQHPKMIFLMSSGQNPTSTTLPLERRKAIADIAHRHNVWIIEDNLYGAMCRDDIPLIAQLAPEQTFLVGSLSKSVAAGVRGGWVACPPHFGTRVRTAHKMMTGGLPFLLAELCARLVLSGDAHRIRQDCIAEVNAREQMVRQIFSGLEFNSNPDIAFVWLKLPEPWLSGTFRNAARKEGILIDDEDEFKAGRSEKVYHRVRISFSAPNTREELARHLHTLRRLLDNGSVSYDSMA
jgi:DNA-binding transcriptional MocR family regulator